MNKIIFSLPGNEKLAERLATVPGNYLGEMELRQFPDGETYLRVLTDVKDKDVVLVCSLHHADTKLVPLYFLAKTLKDLGCGTIALVAPYLGYMRQDKVFKTGEGITSHYFSQLLSSVFDSISTIDPHLHRIKSLSEIYSIPTKVFQSADKIALWIIEHIKQPFLIGPDSESEQWVSAVAELANAPYVILSKKRHGDKHVVITVPEIEKYKDLTPVLLDDIISTGRTMIETIQHLKENEMKVPLCIVVHGIFADNAYEEIKNSGASVFTCNTIPHQSNAIDVVDLLMNKME